MFLQDIKKKIFRLIKLYYFSGIMNNFISWNKHIIIWCYWPNILPRLRVFCVASIEFAPCNYCNHPWCVGHKSYHKALLIMFGCDGISEHATPPFQSSAFCLLVAPCQAISSKHLSSKVNHLPSKYQAYTNYLSSKYQSTVNHVPSKYQATVHAWCMLGALFVLAWQIIGICLVLAWQMVDYAWQVLAVNCLTRSNKQTESAWRKWWCSWNEVFHYWDTWSGRGFKTIHVTSLKDVYRVEGFNHFPEVFQ